MIRTRSRDLGLLASGAGVSSAGAQVTLIGFTTQLYGAGSFAVAGLFVSCTLGAVLGAPVAGWLVDRYRNRMLMVTTLLLQPVILIGLLAGHDVQALLFGLMALLGLSSTVVSTCASVLVPLTTGETEAMRGYSWLSTAQTTGSMTGTVLGGVIAVRYGIELALVLDAATSLAQGLLITRVRVDRDPRLAAEKKNTSASVFEGFAHLRRDRLLLGRLAAQAVGSIAVATALVNEIFLVTGPIGGDDFTYSVMLACWTAGLVTGANLSRRLRGTGVLLAACAIGYGVMALALSAPAAFPHAAVNGVAWLFGGACSALQNVTLNGLVQSRTADAVRGRVFSSVSAITVGSIALSTLSAGGVVGVAGPRVALLVAAGSAALAGCVAVGVILGHRKVRAEAVPLADHPV